MGITIFFIILSIVVIAFTAIFVRKNNRLYNFKQDTKKTKKKQRKNIKNIWGISLIKDDVITVDGNNLIIIELGSIEYRLLNDKEQAVIDSALVKICKTLSYNVQFFSTIVRVDTNKKIEEIRNNMKKQNNQKMIEYGEALIEYLEDIMLEDDLFVRKNYLIISSYEPRKEVVYNLKEYYFNTLKEELANIKITSKMLTDAGIIELLNREFNKNSEENIEGIIKKGGMDFYVKKGEKGKENIVKD